MISKIIHENEKLKYLFSNLATANELFPKTNWYKVMTEINKKSNEFINYDFYDAFSKGQLISKYEIIEALNEFKIYDLGKVYLLGGWIGLLAKILLDDDKFNIEYFRNFELDKAAVEISERVNIQYRMNNWKYKASLLNIHELNYINDTYKTFNQKEYIDLNSSADTIINTSCEHIDNFDIFINKIPKHTLCIFQSNNYNIPEHINISNNVEEFINQCKLSSIIYSKTIKLDKYDRYLIIGKK